MLSAALAVLKTDSQRNEIAEFYRKNKRRLYAIAYSKLKNKAAAEDAVQETFLSIAKYPEKFFEIEAHKKVPYVLIVIRNVISRMLKEANRQQADELPNDFSGSAPSVEDIAIGRISAEELKKFIDNMSSALRDVIKLKAISGLSNSEIADVLGISEGAVRKRISDAYKQIKKFLNEGVNDE